MGIHLCDKICFFNTQMCKCLCMGMQLCDITYVYPARISQQHGKAIRRERKNKRGMGKMGVQNIEPSTNMHSGTRANYASVMYAPGPCHLGGCVCARGFTQGNVCKGLCGRTYASVRLSRQPKRRNMNGVTENGDEKNERA